MEIIQIIGGKQWVVIHTVWRDLPIICSNRVRVGLPLLNQNTPVKISTVKTASSWSLGSAGHLPDLRRDSLKYSFWFEWCLLSHVMVMGGNKSDGPVLSKANWCCQFKHSQFLDILHGNHLTWHEDVRCVLDPFQLKTSLWSNVWRVSRIKNHSLCPNSKVAMASHLQAVRACFKRLKQHLTIQFYHQQQKPIFCDIWQWPIISGNLLKQPNLNLPISWCPFFTKVARRKFSLVRGHHHVPANHLASSSLSSACQSYCGKSLSLFTSSLYIPPCRNVRLILVCENEMKILSVGKFFIRSWVCFLMKSEIWLGWWQTSENPVRSLNLQFKKSSMRFEFAVGKHLVILLITLNDQKHSFTRLSKYFQHIEIFEQHCHQTSSFRLCWSHNS